jgi:hypothetical protein
LYCRLTTAVVAGAGAAEEVACDAAAAVVLATGAVYGACWSTLTFEMLSVNGAAVPAHVQSISVAPHVYISPTVLKAKVGEELAVDEVFVAGAADAVEGAGVVMMGKVDKKNGREGETLGERLQNETNKKQKKR